MSKIVFWSPLHGQGQTSNLHIIALIISLLYKKKALIMQTHFAMNNWEGPLVGGDIDISCTEDNVFFQEIGIDAAVIYSRMNRLGGNILESCCISFPGTSLLLLPGTEIKNCETFERDIGSTACRMVQQAGEHVDIVMIDTNSGKDELSFKLMSSADVVIINLTQRKHVLNKFFIEYGELINKSKNLFFLFGNYDRNSGYNIINCRRKYRKHINKDNSGVIPYSTKYMDAQNESNILNMVREGLNSRKIANIHKTKEKIKRIFQLGKSHVKETDYFFSQACYTTNKIMNMINIEDKRKQIGRGGL